MSSTSGEKIEASKRFVEETKRLYANILLRPLDEKQLSRPPFRFIQELIKSLITETKILRDVYNPNDFDTRKRTWDRQMKVSFVQKLIDFVANNKQPVTGCVASKVVAGLEPNKTNELLQSLARIAQSKLSVRVDERRPRTFTKPPSNGAESNYPVRRHSKTSPAGSANSSRKLSQQGAAAVARTGTGDSTPVESQQGDDTTNFSRKSSVQINNKPPPADLDASSLSPLDVVTTATEQQDQQTRIATTKSSDLINQRKVSNRRMSLSERQTGDKQQPPPPPTLGVSSESDIAKGIQYVRASLKLLGSTMIDIGKTEAQLRDSLVLATTKTNETIAAQ